jgi:hypothetical protein
MFSTPPIGKISAPSLILLGTWSLIIPSMKLLNKLLILLSLPPMLQFANPLLVHENIQNHGGTRIVKKLTNRKGKLLTNLDGFLARKILFIIKNARPLLGALSGEARGTPGKST